MEKRLTILCWNAHWVALSLTQSNFTYSSWVSDPFKFFLLLDFLRVLKMNSLESAKNLKQWNVKIMMDVFFKFWKLVWTTDLLSSQFLQPLTCNWLYLHPSNLMTYKWEEQAVSRQSCIYVILLQLLMSCDIYWMLRDK